jgi:hypothetical protein
MLYFRKFEINFLAASLRTPEARAPRYLHENEYCVFLSVALLIVLELRVAFLIALGINSSGCNSSSAS